MSFDIGTLTGQVSIEDQLSSSLTLIADRVKEFAKDYTEELGTVGLAMGTLGAIAAVSGAAIVGMMITVEELGKEGSKLKGVEDAFDTLAEKAGTTGDVLRRSLSEGVKGTIDEYNLMTATSKLLGSGMQLTADQANVMGQAARELGKATGGDATSGLEMMSGALVTGRVRGLQQQIGLIDLAAGEKKFAESIGTTVDQLNEEGKLEGKRLAIFDATQKYLDRLGMSEVSFKEKIEQAEVAVTEWYKDLAIAVAESPSVSAALDAIGDALKSAFDAESKTLLDAIVDGINRFADRVTEAVPYVVAFAKGVVTFVDAISELIPILEIAGSGILAYYAAVLLANTVTLTGTALVWLSDAAMTALAGSSVEAAAGMNAAALSVNTFALAVGALVGGYKLGTWLEQNTSWARELSDSFEYAALRIRGFTAAEADAMIAQDKITEDLKRQAESNANNKRLLDEQAETGPNSTPPEDAPTGGDPSRFIKDNADKAAAALEAQQAKLEGLWDQYYGVVDKLGNDNLQAQLDGNTRWYDAEINKLDQAKVKNKAYAGVVETINEEINATDMLYIEKNLAAQQDAANKQLAIIDQIAAAMKKADDEMASDEAQRIAIKEKKDKEAFDKFSAGQEQINQVTRDYNDFVMQSTLSTTDYKIAKVEEWKQSELEGFKGTAEQYKIYSAEVEAYAKAQEDEIKATWTKTISDIGKAIPGILQQAFTGGGGWEGAMKSIGSMVGEKIGANLADSLKETLDKTLGKTLGDVIGSALPVIGSLLGPLIGSLMNKLFGTAGRDAVTQFAATFGGFDQLHTKLDELGAAGEQMWIKLTQQTGRNDLKGAQDTIAQINALLQGQTDYLSRLPGEMQKYGLTWEMAGGQAEQANLDGIAKGLIQDFADLSKAGFDVSTITKAMGDDINKYVDEAMRTGSEIPAAMKPLLQKMADMGTLTDDAGNKMTDLSSLTFSETLTEGFNSIVDAIKILTKALTGSDPGSLKNALNDVGNTVTRPKIKPIYDDSDLPPDMRTGFLPGDNPGGDTGGSGGSIGTGSPSGSSPAYGGPRGGSITVNVPLSIDGEVVTRRVVQTFVNAGL